MSKGIRFGLVALVVGFGLAGCASKGHDSSSASSQHRGGYNSAETQGLGGGSNFSGQDSWNRSSGHQDLMAKKTYYFGFDRYDVMSEDYPSIEAHAQYLANNPRARVRVEGHTDERGSREYNIALGERRAKSLADALLSAGAQAYQLSVVSYGEEKPAVLNSNEAAYEKNRRALIVYEE